VTAVAGGLITLEFALEGLKYGPKDDAPSGELSARDADVAAYILAATAAIEFIVGPVLPVVKVKLFDGGRSAVLLPHPIASAAAVTEVKIDGTVTTDFFVDADSSIVYSGAPGSAGYFPDGRKNIQITYATGYSTVPQGIQIATRELVKSRIMQKEANNLAGELILDPSTSVPMSFDVPKRVAEMLQPFRKINGFA
jgi:hypothetical protein